MDLSQWHFLFYLKTLVKNGLLFSAQSNIFKPIFAQCEVNACVSGGMSYECVDKSSWSLSRPGEMHREEVKGVASIALATPFFICMYVCVLLAIRTFVHLDFWPSSIWPSGLRTSGPWTSSLWIFGCQNSDHLDFSPFWILAIWNSDFWPLEF